MSSGRLESDRCWLLDSQHPLAGRCGLDSNYLSDGFLRRSSTPSIGSSTVGLPRITYR